MTVKGTLVIKLVRTY